MTQTIFLDHIQIKPDRQRKDLGSLEELKVSILQVGTLINPIVVEPQPSRPGYFWLIAGERRFTAWNELYTSGQIHPEIPVTVWSDLDEPARQLIELEENIKRKDLTWQEHVQATAKLYALKGFQNYQEAAPYFGVAPSTLSYTMQLAANMDNPKVAEAPTIQAAHSIVKRDNARAIDNLSMEISDFFKNEIQQEKEESKNDQAQPQTTGSSGQISQPAASTSEAQRSPVKTNSEDLATSPYRIQQGDFLEFARSYSGKPFDFLHLDFPYGINHDRSKQGNTASYGTYEDSEDVYKTLVQALLQNQDRLVAEKAHCICWLSWRFADWTREVFQHAGWACHMQPLVWHKSDNKGIIADVQCGFRNVGEYALFFNRGRKAVVKNISNIYSGPTTKRFHASEKPLPMLKHFFSGLCDHYSRVLDPTCGSGTAIMAAEFFGAEEALGLELNPEFAKAAQEYLAVNRGSLESNLDLTIDLEDLA